ncbi:MAG TPA: DUF4129 domain-containing protein [Candidatus Polarisedimenticolia bacterium]|nr:DUF4129 domain-containing protein [Candidatus Polarisedimenticolia bacterium]
MKSLRAAALALLIGYLPASAASAPDDGIGLEQYIGTLETLLELIPDPPAPAERITRAAAGLPDELRVRYDGRTIRAPVAGVRDALIEASASGLPASDLDRIRAHLGTMLLEARAALQSRPPDLSGPQARLDTILARPEFGGGAGSDWFGALRSSVSDWMARLMKRIFGDSSDAGSLLLETAAWAGVAVLLAAAVVWTARMAGRPRPSGSIVADARDDALEGSRDWAELAAREAGAGRHRDAVRCAWWAAVRRLEEAGAWRVDRARTHREYLRLLPDEDGMRPAMREVTDLFEQVWYGGRPATQDDSRRTLMQLRSLGCDPSSSQAIAGS